jgi:phosphoribosylformylglycinamidine synthase subunit PurQ / glutaminase
VSVKVLILHASGTNRDREAAWACQLAGGEPEIIHINQLAAGQRRLGDYGMLVLPGGFSFGDALGAGKLLGLTLRHSLQDDLLAFIAGGRPVLGICNGFQALVKAGVLPGGVQQPATLTFNASARFECRWVTLVPDADCSCVFTRRLSDPIYCPVAHGEGQFVSTDREGLQQAKQVALRYAFESGALAFGDYPANPNGSAGDIAGVCNPAGNVLGLMPHPEDHVVAYQHPRWTRGEAGRSGLPLFRSGIQYAQG